MRNHHTQDLIGASRALLEQVESMTVEQQRLRREWGGADPAAGLGPACPADVAERARLAFQQDLADVEAEVAQEKLRLDHASAPAGTAPRGRPGRRLMI